MKNLRGLLALGLLLLLTTGCGIPKRDDWSSHVLAFDERGRLVDPVEREPIDDDEGRAAYYRRLLAGMDRGCDGFCAKQAGAGPEVRKVFLHVHGGMVGFRSAMRQAHKCMQALADDEVGRQDDWHYPIFVQWPSAPLGSYRDHVARIRQGRWAPWTGLLTSPIFLATDLARGVARLPRSALFQYGLDAAVGLRVGLERDVLPSWKSAAVLEAQNVELGGGASPRGHYDLLRGDYRRGALRQGYRFLCYWLTQVVKLPVQTLVLDGLGQGAWDTMLWRAYALLWAPETFNLDGDAEEARAALQAQPTGHLAEFLRALKAHTRQQKRERNVRYEITLIGHSMGAIILNEALPLIDPEDVARLVYMAPACSIREAADTVVPFLEAHPQKRLHILTLHPIAEADEINAWDLPPRGSLLEWIDNWYTTPSSHLDRRLGKWINVVQALPVFERVRRQLSVKAFGVDGSSIPQEHGQFNDAPFWREEFWSNDGELTFPEDWAAAD